MSPYEIIAVMILLINLLVSVVSLCYTIFKDNKK